MRLQNKIKFQNVWTISDEESFFNLKGRRKIDLTRMVSGVAGKVGKLSLEVGSR